MYQSKYCLLLCLHSDPCCVHTLLHIVLRSYKGPSVIICYFPSAPSSLWADNLVHHYRRLTVRETVANVLIHYTKDTRDTTVNALINFITLHSTNLSFFLPCFSSSLSWQFNPPSCELSSSKAWKADIVLWSLLWRQLMGVTCLLSMSFPDV